jgi:hypothetical protein
MGRWIVEGRIRAAEEEMGDVVVRRFPNADVMYPYTRPIVPATCGDDSGLIFWSWFCSPRPIEAFPYYYTSAIACRELSM